MDEDPFDVVPAARPDPEGGCAGTGRGGAGPWRGGEGLGPAASRK